MPQKKLMVWLITFWAMLVSPSLVMATGLVPIENNENRALATRPVFSLENLSTYPQAYDEYYKDNLPLKTQLVRFNSWVDYKLFEVSSSPDVVIGKNGWLFYNSKTDGADVEVYKGLRQFGPDDMNKIAGNLEIIRQWCEARGIEFVLFIAPNKEMVYSEELQNMILRVYTEDRTDLLVSYLRENTNVRVVYPKAELLAAKKSGQIYYKLDTHWNNMGAFVGASALLNELDIQSQPFQEAKFERQPRDTGDLAQMLNLSGSVGEDSEYYLGNANPPSIEPLVTDFYGEYKYFGNREKKLFVSRDSFSSAMMQYVAPYFSESTFHHITSFVPSMIEAASADIYVFQIVERSLPILINYNFK